MCLYLSLFEKKTLRFVICTCSTKCLYILTKIKSQKKKYINWICSYENIINNLDIYKVKHVYNHLQNFLY